MKLTLHLEPYPKRTAESVRQDIQYIIENYASHPAFYRTTPKNATKDQKELPLLYVYDSYLISVDDWMKITTESGSHSIRNTTNDALLIGNGYSLAQSRAFRPVCSIGGPFQVEESGFRWIIYVFRCRRLLAWFHYG